jgi:hypothetical protein
MSEGLPDIIFSHIRLCQACLQRKTLVLAARLVYETRIHMDGRQRLPVGDRLTVGPQTLTLVV